PYTTLFRSDIAVPVVDLHECAIPGTLSRPGDDARGDRDDVLASTAGEVHALVIGLATGEGVLTFAEIRGDETLGHRASLGVDLLLQIPRENHVLERKKLGIAQLDPLV